MCGHVGMAGDLLPVHEKILKTLLIFDAVRGEDSTGIAGIGKWKGAEVNVAKQLGNPWQLFEHRSYEDIMKVSQRAIIGHNRYATSGGVKRSTAHPFENDMLVGAHNGTLTNKWQLLDGNNYSVDSEALYHHIAVKGLDDAIQTAEGAWSLVWWDKEEETLNFLRNKERPMYIAMSAGKDGKSDGKCLFWASEEWMLDQALWRCGQAHSQILQTEVDCHIAFPIEQAGKIGKPTIRRMPEKVEKVLPSQGNKFLAVAGGGVLTTAGTSTAKKESGSVSMMYDRGYLKAKNVSFEVLSEVVTGTDGDYLLLSDPNHPYKEIRVYPKDDQIVWGSVGCWATGDIKAAAEHKTTPNKVYYTVDPESFVVYEPEPEVRFSLSQATCTETVFNAMGLTCDWCTSPLIFGENNQFSSNKQCFCPACAEQEEVKTTVNFN